MKSSENKMLSNLSSISKKFSFAAALGMLLLGLGMQPAKSALTGKGIEHPVNHFPTWYSDSNGVSLQLCLDGDGTTPCLFDPVIPGNPTSVATGFGAEAFWWSADATMDLAGGGRALLVLALEAAYNGGDPAPNDQFAFGRIRIRIDAPADGAYQVEHPYLSASCQPEVFNVTAGTRTINVTRDIGGGAPFNTALNSEIGPFLVWDPAIAPTAPTGYVGDPDVPHQVVNGRCGINHFRITAPVGVDLDGNGNNVVETNLFSVQGKIFDEVNTPPGIEPVRTTYFRSTNATTNVSTARINGWVKAPPSATVNLVNPLTNQSFAMTFDGESTFFRRIVFNAANSVNLPEQVTFTAVTAGGTTTQDVNVVDQVSIQTVTWTASTQALRVVALTSDRIRASAGPIPVLTLKIGTNTFPMTPTATPGRYEVTVTGITVPPAQVTVTSSKGGSDTEGMSD